MESPFRPEWGVEIRDATEWILDGVELAEGEACDDGEVPADIRRKWEPWITECIEFMLDGDGTFRRFRYDLPLDEQPWIDLLVYRIVRAKYMALVRRKHKGSDG